MNDDDTDAKTLVSDEEADRILHAMGLDLDALQYLKLAERHQKAVKALIEKAAHLSSNVGCGLLFTNMTGDCDHLINHLEKLQE